MPRKSKLGTLILKANFKFRRDLNDAGQIVGDEDLNALKQQLKSANPGRQQLVQDLAAFFALVNTAGQLKSIQGRDLFCHVVEDPDEEEV